MASEILSSNMQSSLFIQQHSAPLRIWHWLTFLFITTSIITVLISSTLLSPRDNVKLIQEQLERKGVTVTPDQAFAISHEYEDKMWDVHKLAGYGLALLLLARIAIEFTQPEEEKLVNRLKKVKELRAKSDSNKAECDHYLRVKMAYTIFFLILLGLVLTGLGMAFGRNFGFSREIFRGMKNIHAFLQYLMYAFVLIHLAGVIISENGKNKGLVSGMINGNR